MGFILTLSSLAHSMALLTFFITSSKVTKFRSARKKKIEADFKEGGQRNWIQVLCNGGMATQLALLYLLDIGSGERPIDFDKEYRSSWLSIGIIGNSQYSNILFIEIKMLLQTIVLNFKYCTIYNFTFYRSICVL